MKTAHARRQSAAVTGDWPAVPAVRTGGARAAVARALLTAIAARIPIVIALPDGSRSGSGGARAPVLRLHDPGAFFARVGGGAAGFAESYMAEEWDCEDLPGLFTVFAAHVPRLIPAPLRAFRRLYVPPQPAGQDASIEGARRNIEHHYDLSNEFFELFLDPTLTYSGALFGAEDTLEQAQQRKIDRLLDMTETGPGTRLLEVGTGWGELALRAASRGAEVTSLTISPAQFQVASARAAAAGLDGLIDVQLRDYREARGRYDVVLSVEMIEAVGMAYWPVYFRAIDRLLAQGGRAAIQAITMPHDRMLATMHGQTWIHQYIFPGGQIPSLRALHDVLARSTRLRITSDLAMGHHYARTLSQWRARFAAAEGDVESLGFSRPFRRMWDLYLAYSQAGFAAGYLDVHQLVLERGD
jgi:cyclopropane-fatty-acyl-phospholipid synthase